MRKDCRPQRHQMRTVSGCRIKSWLGAMDDANRKMNFTILFTEQERLGKRVESRTDYAAVLAKGEPVNHALHLPVTILTLGL